MSRTIRRPLPLKTLALWIGIVAVLGTAVTAFNCYRARQDHAAQVAAFVKHQIATHWQPDPAMKFAHIQSLTLAPAQPGWYHGNLVYKFGEYEKTIPVSVLMKEGGEIEWAMDAPNCMPMHVETVAACEIFVEYPVTGEEAGRFAGWLFANGHIGEEPGSYFLRKAGPTFVVYLSVQDGNWPNAEFEKIAGEIAKRLPREVFDGAAVEVRICDRQLRTLKVIAGR